MEDLVKKNLIPFIFFIGLGSILIVAVFQYFYAPDIDSILQLARKIAFLPLHRFHPEPEERLSSIIFFASLLFLSAIYAKYLSGKIDLYFEKHSFLTYLVPLSFIALLLSLIYITFGHNYYKSPLSYLDIYFMWQRRSPYYVSFILLYSFILYSFFSEKIQKYIIKYSHIIFTVFLLFALYVLYKENYPSIYASLHFNALFFSQYQVSVNHLTLCTGNFKNTYGLYPQFLETVFHFVPLTIENFKLIFIVLTGLSYLLLYLFFINTLKNNFFVLTNILLYIYYMSLYRVEVGSDIYFQYFPLRTFFPFLIMYLITIYNKRKNPFLFFFISSLLPFAILWNPDSGIMSFLIWIGYLIYSGFYLPKITAFLRKIMFELITVLCIIIVLLFAYKFYIYLSEHLIFSFKDLFLTIKMFGKLGYLMIPLPDLHPYIVYLLLIVIATATIISKISVKKDIGLLLFTMWMVASFMYFQGRSHPYTFFSIVVNILIIIPFFLESWQRSFVDTKLLYVTLKIIYAIIVSYLLSFAFLMICDYSTDPYYKLIYSEKAPSAKKVDFIKKYTKKNEKILILDGREQGILHSRTDTVPAFDIGLVDIFLRSDYSKMTNMIAEGKIKKLFITENKFEKYTSLLKKRYTLIRDHNASMIYIRIYDEK